eukprot:CAMPEP_0201487224 /NCGR_PEP_ID=MMETSP0151_2-20130828/11611_1 /ASSEMBLY_ACC=CAM_ASM_000257 /TAXON_ID=200890 /ORGANISM="Paramoeba atlantica, Strain 621/1 / CCAP 1560/9" /LENGTH=300 /DNA_ID=CAMNT_0047872209 /DNA_START=54 /DNA_END=956 /DNA_ORIENTATION=+
MIFRGARIAPLLSASTPSSAIPFTNQKCLLARLKNTEVEFEKDGSVKGAQYQVGVPDYEHTRHVPGPENPGVKYGMYKRPLDFSDPYSKHQNLVSFEKGTIAPKVAGNSWVAPNATLCGNVEVWHYASVWYNVVIRGDCNLVRIGAYTNVQDGTVIDEAFEPLNSDHDGSTIIGHYVTIGHGCLLRACTIEDECHIGMGSILLDGSYMEKGSLLGANTVVQPHCRIPSGQLWVGNPAKYLRDLTEDEKAWIKTAAEAYHDLSNVHKEEFFLPPSTYLQAEREGHNIGWKSRLFDASVDGH